MLPHQRSPESAVAQVFKSSYEYSMHPNISSQYVRQHQPQASTSMSIRETSLNRKNSNNSIGYSSITIKQHNAGVYQKAPVQRELGPKQQNKNNSYNFVTTSFDGGMGMGKGMGIDYKQNKHPSSSRIGHISHNNGINFRMTASSSDYGDNNNGSHHQEKKFSPSVSPPPNPQIVRRRSQDRTSNKSRALSERNSLVRGNGNQSEGNSELVSASINVDQIKMQNQQTAVSTDVKQKQKRKKQFSKQTDVSQALNQLKQRIVELQRQSKLSASTLSLHSGKILLLEESLSVSSVQGKFRKTSQQIEKSPEKSKSSKLNHSSSISTTSSSPVSFKELSDIMSLLEQTKGYQKKNFDEYRKMIQEFRGTILQFRDELNKTIKKQDFDLEMQKFTESVQEQLDLQRQHQQQSTTTDSRIIEKSSLFLQKTLESDVKKMQTEISKLLDSNLSLKAQISRVNNKQKQSSEDNRLDHNKFSNKLSQIEEKLSFDMDNCHKSNRKYEGQAIQFGIINELIINPAKSSPKQSEQHNMLTQRLKEKAIGMMFKSDATEQSQQQRKVTLKQKTYRIDKDGNLMDKDNVYLLNDRNKQIKLSQKQMDVLRANGVLK